MKVLPTELPGVLLLEPQVFADDRGYFLETFHADRYAAVGIPGPFVQDNVSLSRRGVLRGLHFQWPRAQGKLVQVLAGEVFDVAVDIRAGSPTYGRWLGVYLSAENGRQLWIPPGFAHGFQATTAEALFAYKCTAVYDPSGDTTILWDDPAIGVEWPLRPPILSPKDARGHRLEDLPEERRPLYRVAGGR